MLDALQSILYRSETSFSACSVRCLPKFFFFYLTPFLRAWFTATPMTPRMQEKSRDTTCELSCCLNLQKNPDKANVDRKDMNKSA